MELLNQLDGQTWLWLVGVVGFIVAWEWKKVIMLKDQVANLEQRMSELHADHQKLLTANASEHAQVMRGITVALSDLHRGIGELTHYIKWLGKQQTGAEAPPSTENASG